MTCLKFTLPASGTAPDLRTLPHPLTERAFLEIEHAFIGALSTLGRELFGIGLGMAPEPVASRTDAADVEYASWMPDPGAIEVASWTADLRTAVR
jgi:hypothetical protein